MFICSVRANLFLFLFLYGWATISASAQHRFCKQQTLVVKSASEQWLCSELKKVNPAYFNCEHVLWQLPEPGLFPICNDSMELSPELVKCFQDIWFPRGDCNRFLSILAMADVYMPLFKRKVEQLQLHEHVAFFPIVLSGCNQQYAKGDCSGLWAMPQTAASKYGLRVDSLVDERRGGDFTTDAALHWIHDMWKGENGDYRAVLNQIEFASCNSESKKPRNQESLLAAFLAYTIRLFESSHGVNQLNYCFDILGQFQPVIIQNAVTIKSIVDALGIDEKNLRAVNPVYTGEWLVPGYRRVPFVLENTVVGRFNTMRLELEQKSTNRKGSK
jgi:hypothetical protein